MTIHDGLGGGLGSATVVLVARRIRSRAPVLIEHEEGRGSVAVVVELGPVDPKSSTGLDRARGGERLRSGRGRVGPGRSSLPPVLTEHELVELPGRSSPLLSVCMYVCIYISEHDDDRVTV